MGKAILFSAPSGCGKTTIIRELMQYFDCFDFSISATSRQPREGEQDGKDYYFLTHDEFKSRVAMGDFLEWEEMYQGTCYGTLKSEIDRIWNCGRVIVFDVNVNGVTLATMRSPSSLCRPASRFWSSVCAVAVPTARRA